MVRAAIEDGIQNGRNGLGSIQVWAGGNGREGNLEADRSDYDQFASSRYTIDSRWLPRKPTRECSQSDPQLERTRRVIRKNLRQAKT